MHKNGSWLCQNRLRGGRLSVKKIVVLPPIKAIIITRLFLLFETSVILHLKCSVFINYYIIFLSAVSFLDNHKLETGPKSCSWFPTSIGKNHLFNCLFGVRRMFGFYFYFLFKYRSLFLKCKHPMAFPHTDSNPNAEDKPVILPFHSPRMPQMIRLVMAKKVALLNALGLPKDHARNQARH